MNYSSPATAPVCAGCPAGLPQSAGVDAIGAALSLLAYLVVAIVVLAVHRRDIRARLFMAIALANVVPYGFTILSWRWSTEAALSRAMVASILVSLGIGAIALFHFAQVFPRLRPWVAAHGRWLPALYAIVPLVAIALVAAAPSAVEDLAPAYGIALMVAGIPWIFVVLIALPFAGLLSLYASWREIKGERDPAATPTLLILVSQLAGGVLAIVVIPMLRGAGGPEALATAASLLLAACGLLMPIAFGYAVWHREVLSARAAV